MRHEHLTGRSMQLVGEFNFEHIAPYLNSSGYRSCGRLSIFVTLLRLATAFCEINVREQIQSTTVVYIYISEKNKQCSRFTRFLKDNACSSKLTPPPPPPTGFVDVVRVIVIFIIVAVRCGCYLVSPDDTDFGLASAHRIRNNDLRALRTHAAPPRWQPCKCRPCA